MSARGGDVDLRALLSPREHSETTDGKLRPDKPLCPAKNAGNLTTMTSQNQLFLEKYCLDLYGKINIYYLSVMT